MSNALGELAALGGALALVVAAASPALTAPKRRGAQLREYMIVSGVLSLTILAIVAVTAIAGR